MISRSESEPITMETRGLSVIAIHSPRTKLCSLLQCPRADVATIVHILEADAVYGLIGLLDGVFKLGGAGGQAQHPTAARIEPVVAQAGSGVKDLHILQT